MVFLMTLKRRDLSPALVITRHQRNRPMLSQDEPARLLEAAPASNTRLRSGSRMAMLKPARTVVNGGRGADKRVGRG